MKWENDFQRQRIEGLPTKGGYAAGKANKERSQTGGV